MLKAIVFDMGGTLLHFAPPGSASWRELETPGIRSLYRYLHQQGHALTAQEDEFVEVMFKRLGEGWAQATSGQANLSMHEWIAAVAANRDLRLDDAKLRSAAYHYAQPLRATVRAADGAVALLAALHGRGLRLGLVSNTIWPGEFHLEDLAALGLLPYFGHTLFSGDLGIWKPQPDIFQHMLAALDTSPAETLFVGDNPLEDIQGAQRVGMRAVWVRNTEFPLGQVQPDAIVDALSELLDVVSSLQASSLNSSIQ